MRRYPHCTPEKRRLRHPERSPRIRCARFWAQQSIQTRVEWTCILPWACRHIKDGPQMVVVAVRDRNSQIASCHPRPGPPTLSSRRAAEGSAVVLPFRSRKNVDDHAHPQAGQTRLALIRAKPTPKTQRRPGSPHSKKFTLTPLAIATTNCPALTLQYRIFPVLKSRRQDHAHPQTRRSAGVLNFVILNEAQRSEEPGLSVAEGTSRFLNLIRCLKKEKTPSS
jgi:hypothetical protein